MVNEGVAPDGKEGRWGWGWVGESGGLVMCLLDRCLIGIIERGAKQVRQGKRGEGRGVGMESESARRERRMESARGRVILTSGRERVHTKQSRFLFFFCAFPTCARVKKMAFLSGFAEQFQLSSTIIVELLKEQAFDCETALPGLSEENLKELESLKLGERVALRVAAVRLQSRAGGGPLV